MINNKRSNRENIGLGYKEKYEKDPSPSMKKEEDGYEKYNK